MKKTPHTHSSTVDRIIDHYGSPAAVARRFDIVPMAVTQWRRRGVPVKYCPQIEADTGIACHDLRPDVFPAPKAVA